MQDETMEVRSERNAGARRRTVDVIIPTYKPDKKFSRLLRMLELQTYPIRRIIVMNTEKSYWNDKGYEGIKGLEVHHLTKAEFDNGRTRNQGGHYGVHDGRRGARRQPADRAAHGCV